MNKKHYILINLVLIAIISYSQQDSAKFSRHSFGLNVGLNYCFGFSSQEENIEPELAYSYGLNYYYNFNEKVSLKSGFGNSIFRHHSSQKFINNVVYTSYWNCKYYYLPLEVNYTKNNFIYNAGIKLYLLHAYSFEIDRYITEVNNAIKELPFDQVFEYGINAGLGYNVHIKDHLNLQISILKMSFFSIPLVPDKKRFLVFESGIDLKFF